MQKKLKMMIGTLAVTCAISACSESSQATSNDSNNQNQVVPSENKLIEVVDGVSKNQTYSTVWKEDTGAFTKFRLVINESKSTFDVDTSIVITHPFGVSQIGTYKVVVKNGYAANGNNDGKTLVYANQKAGNYINVFSDGSLIVDQIQNDKMHYILSLQGYQVEKTAYNQLSFNGSIPLDTGSEVQSNPQIVSWLKNNGKVVSVAAQGWTSTKILGLFF